MTLNPEQFLYHVAPVEYRASIRSRGLQPGESNAVWFFSDKNRLQATGDSDVWRARAADVPQLEHGSEWSAEWSPDDPVHATGSPVQKIQRVKIR